MNRLRSLSLVELSVEHPRWIVFLTVLITLGFLTQFPKVRTDTIAGGKALPKPGVFAHSQADVVAASILARLDGREPGERFGGNGWCAIETGGGSAAFGSGDFYAEGGPQVDLHAPARHWHWGKVLFEKWWLSPFGPKREALRLSLNLGARARGIPVSL